MRLGCTTRFGWAGVVLDRDSRLHIGLVPRRAVTIDFNGERALAAMVAYDPSYVRPFQRSLRSRGWWFVFRHPVRSVRTARAYEAHQARVTRVFEQGSREPWFDQEILPAFRTRP